jgi:uncharacterized protein YndB with AHSA1/START domain
VIDPHTGGRCYEINIKGETCIWGRVLAWEPPKKVVLSWHLQPDWSFSPDLARANEVAMEFIAEGPEQTRLEFEHRHLERHGAGWESLREQIGSAGGWPTILELYLEAAK